MHLFYRSGSSLKHSRYVFNALGKLEITLTWELLRLSNNINSKEKKSQGQLVRATLPVIGVIWKSYSTVLLRDMFIS